MPIAVALILPAVLYMFWFGYPLPTITHTLTNALDSFPLLAVPLFVLVGNLMGASGIARACFTLHICASDIGRAGLHRSTSSQA
jgi:surface polysaccharide O-acyltransferase-like enzyme